MPRAVRRAREASDPPSAARATLDLSVSANPRLKADCVLKVLEAVSIVLAKRLIKAAAYNRSTQSGKAEGSSV